MRPARGPASARGPKPAQELRGIGHQGYQLPEWKKVSLGASVTTGKVTKLSLKDQRE